MDLATTCRQDGRIAVHRGNLRPGCLLHAQKNELKPWLKPKQWCIPGPPGKPNARFVTKMEDVLEVYIRPYNPRRPLVCIDEKSKELHSQLSTRQPLPLQPGSVARQDYEYKREGTANIFMMVEPLAGKRWVRVTDRRTKLDFAEQLRIMVMVDERYPEAEVDVIVLVVVVVDNLNTHGPWRGCCTRTSHRRKQRA